MKISNRFTLARAVFSPIFFFLYFIPIFTGRFTQISAGLMIPLLALFELTDYFDGHFARKNGAVSDFGKLFDPFADVMLNLTVFVCAMFSVTGRGYMPVWIFIFILYREFSMLFLRMCAVKRGTAIAARKGGKLKTVFYIASGFYALAVESLLRMDPNILPQLPTLRKIAAGLFLVCGILSYASFIDYIIHFAKVFQEDEK